MVKNSSIAVGKKRFTKMDLTCEQEGVVPTFSKCKH